MIISNEHRFLLATPSKCGTYSWEGFAKKTAGLFVIRPMHLCVPPERWKQPHDTIRPDGRGMRSKHVTDPSLKPHVEKGLTPYISVRHPMARLVSVWGFLCDPSMYSQWRPDGCETGDSFATFLEAFAADKEKYDQEEWMQGKSPWTWTKSLTQCAEALWTDEERVDYILPLKLEEMATNLQWLVIKYGLGWDGRVRHSNSLVKHRKPEWRSYYPSRLKRTAINIWGEDLETYDYDF